MPAPFPAIGNEIFSATPLAVGAQYSIPVDIEHLTVVGLRVKFTLGSLTNIVLTAQVFDGDDDAWIDLYGGDATALWTLTLTGNKDVALVIGDPSNNPMNPIKIPFSPIRIKIVATGTVTSSSLVLRKAGS